MSDAERTPDIGERVDIIPELGERIRLIAEAHGGRQKFADLLGVTYARLAAWIRGESEPRAYHLRRIAHLGDTTVDALLCDHRDRPQEDLWSDLRNRLGDVVTAARITPKAGAISPAEGIEIGKLVTHWLAFEAYYRQRRSDAQG